MARRLVLLLVLGLLIAGGITLVGSDVAIAQCDPAGGPCDPGGEKEKKPTVTPLPPSKTPTSIPSPTPTGLATPTELVCADPKVCLGNPKCAGLPPCPGGAPTRTPTVTPLAVISAPPTPSDSWPWLAILGLGLLGGGGLFLARWDFFKRFGVWGHAAQPIEGGEDHTNDEVVVNPGRQRLDTTGMSEISGDDGVVVTNNDGLADAWEDGGWIDGNMDGISQHLEQTGTEFHESGHNLDNGHGGESSQATDNEPQDSIPDD